MDSINDYSNEDILLLLDYYYLELNYYKKKLNLLNKHKPFFFELKKLKQYKKELLDIENNIKLYEEKITNIINESLNI